MFLKFRISSLNIILSSHIWQQDHNGYTHQEPGFLDHLATKKGDIANIYLPYDANSLIYTMDKCLKTKDKIIGKKNKTKATIKRFINLFDAFFKASLSSCSNEPANSTLLTIITKIGAKI